MAESRAERKARRALIEAAEGSEEKKSSKKSKPSQNAKGKSAKDKAKAKRSDSRRGGDKAPRTRSKRPHNDSASSARKAVDPKSPCSIMKACGGCTALNRPYKKQLAAKQAAMEELLLPFASARVLASTPFVVWVSPWKTRASILRRVVFVIRPPPLCPRQRGRCPLRLF